MTRVNDGDYVAGTWAAGCVKKSSQRIMPGGKLCPDGPDASTHASAIGNCVLPFDPGAAKMQEIRQLALGGNDRDVR
jgi:hypothetical protein